INIFLITWRWVGIAGWSRWPHSGFYPAMRFRMGVRKGDYARSFFAVKPARRGEKWRRIIRGNFKRRVADADRFRFDENKELSRPSEGRIALVEVHGRDRCILLSAPVHVIIHRVAAQFRDLLAPQFVNGTFSRAAIYRWILPI